MRKIGLFGGTFDPPHIGHVSIAKIVLNKVGLDELWFIPTYHPPHKEKATATPLERLEMLKYLLEEDERFSISTIEYELKGLSYTYHTVKLLKEKYPDVEFYFIIGGDMIDYLPKWYKIDELMQMIQFIGVRRKGFDIEEHPNVKLIDIKIVPVSSSTIRKQLKEGKIPEGVPEKVLEYIREKRLYEH